jgi:hypothetical protein
MKMLIDVPLYEERDGFRFDWEDNFKIQVKAVQDTVHITANKEGLISLARHLLALSQDAIRLSFSPRCYERLRR